MIIENLFLGIGAMKAGTTWVYKLAGHHPDIYFSYEKETHYFAEVNLDINPLSISQRYEKFRDSLNHINPEQFDPLILRRKLLWYANYLSEPVDDAWYLNLFSHRKAQKYCADFSNLHCQLDSQGWEHVRNLANNIKVIYILRHPWKRLWSHMRFHSAIVGQFDDLKNWNADEMYAFAKQRHIWVNTEYSKSIKLLRENLTEDEYRVFFFEDIHCNQEKWLRELEQFLGIYPFEYDQHLLNSKVNISKSLPMPNFFPDLFRIHFENEMEELEVMGLNIPISWKTF